MDNDPMRTFNFNGADVRVVFDEREEPWWVAADVCRVLEHTNASVGFANGEPQ